MAKLDARVLGECSGQAGRATLPIFAKTVQQPTNGQDAPVLLEPFGQKVTHIPGDVIQTEHGYEQGMPDVCFGNLDDRDVDLERLAGQILGPIEADDGVDLLRQQLFDAHHVLNDGKGVRVLDV